MQREPVPLALRFMALQPVRDLRAGREGDPFTQALKAQFSKGEVSRAFMFATGRKMWSASCVISLFSHMLHSQTVSRRSGNQQMNKPLASGGMYKIIHAKTIEIFGWHRPVLRLSGQLGKATWEAMVKITDYVRLSQANCEDALA